MPARQRASSPLSRRFIAAMLACAGLACHPAHALAQPATTPEEDTPAGVPPEAYEGRTVAEVGLVQPPGDDAPALSDTARQTARNNIRSYAGGPYDRETISDDLRRLNRVGLFSRVECRAVLLDNGQVRLEYELTERPVIVDVQVTGNEKVSDRLIAEQVDLRIGVPVDRFQVDRAARKIERLYRERGYYLARVSVDEQALADTSVVLFRVREGERLRVTSIRFEGARSIREDLLRRELETKTSGLFRKGALEDDQLDTDIANLIDYYKDRGFLDVRAAYDIQPAPNGKEAIVTYLIEEGPRYTLRSLQAVFSTEDDRPPVYTEAQLAGLVRIKPGDDYGVRALDEAVQTVEDAYGKQGYADVTVTRRDKRDPDAPVVDLTLFVNEGRRYTTGEVIIQGNEITRDSVVRREVQVAPGMPLDTTALEATEEQIRRRNIFDRNEIRLTIQPPDPDEPDVRDVLIEIKETNTGELNIGGAISSDSGVVGRLGFVQRNFDIRDPPDSFGDFFSGKAFRGGGQTFRIEALPGNQVQTFNIALTDPALNDTDYSGSANIFYRNRNFDEFDERRWGARLSLGRRFGTRWNGAANVRIETINLGDLQPDRPTDIFAVADENLLTSLDLTLTRTTLDRFVFPTEGTRTQLSVSQVGVLGGDFDYTKLAAEGTTYFALREDIYGRATTIKFEGMVGWSPQGQDEVPTYERFYLGGQSFRGLDFRTVSPKGIRNDNGLPSDDPVGGTWLFFAGAEITQPLFEEILSGAVFIDSGTVTEDPGFDDYRVTAGFGLRVVVPALSPAPLAFDFGWPIIKEDSDETRVFSFTLDVPF
ncbi:MAG: outer membrane protein assembly factor BamA [Phycisphaerales bacterium JB040]